MWINRHFRDFLHIFSSQWVWRRVFFSYSCLCSQHSWWEITGWHFSEGRREQRKLQITRGEGVCVFFFSIFQIVVILADLLWTPLVSLAKARIRSTWVAKHINKINKTSWELLWIIMSLIPVWVITQHKLQAKHTFFWHRRIISFFARSKLLFHFPAELLLCHLLSNLSAESSLSVQHQPGGAQSPGLGWVTVQIRPSDIWISGRI